MARQLGSILQDASAAVVAPNALGVISSWSAPGVGPATHGLLAGQAAAAAEATAVGEPAVQQQQVWLRPGSLQELRALLQESCSSSGIGAARLVSGNTGGT
jgi:hypothetical protein